MDRAKIYHDMTGAELQTAYKSKKEELFNLRFQHSIGQLKNPKQLEMVKRDVARILTVLKIREGK